MRSTLLTHSPMSLPLIPVRSAILSRSYGFAPAMSRSSVVLMPTVASFSPEAGPIPSTSSMFM